MKATPKQVADYIVSLAYENANGGKFTAKPEDVCSELCLDEYEYIAMLGDVIEELTFNSEVTDLVDVGDGFLDLELALRPDDIVRCGDCRFNGNRHQNFGTVYCNVHGYVKMKNTDFCSRGKERDDYL